MSEKSKNILLGVLIVGLVSMTVAYAALSTSLTINGQATVEATKWDIHFANVDVDETNTTDGLTYDLGTLDNAISTSRSIGTAITGMSAILNKPGKLTDEEFAIMKSHTTKGAKILADISTIPNIVEGAKYHHERYGGGGYPEGLKGEEIPYIARIICCADCYDAMATRRVYKDPYPKEKIIDEFEKCKNTQFDPKIADVVIKLIKEGKLFPNE